jgi:predicted nucleic acid-binding protein
MTREVLDASVVISFFEGRAGAEQIEAMLMEPIAGRIELRMSVINWGEVYYSTWRAHGLVAARKTAAEISQLPIELVNADLELTRSAAELHAKYNLPYAECFAAGLSRIWKASLVTSDRDFAKVKSEIDLLFL